PDWLRSFSTATKSMPEIMGVYRMSGDLDYLIRAQVTDMAGYDRLYQRLIAKVPLSDVSASFVMEEIKETTALPL
ncbi:MAG: Lrp/AsnC ligand binding domain-containing protein, partial [Sulfitobacter geojensis]